MRRTVSAKGIEPLTNDLKDQCSTTELYTLSVLTRYKNKPSLKQVKERFYYTLDCLFSLVF